MCVGCYFFLFFDKIYFSCNFEKFKVVFRWFIVENLLFFGRICCSSCYRWSSTPKNRFFGWDDAPNSVMVGFWSCFRTHFTFFKNVWNCKCVEIRELQKTISCIFKYVYFRTLTFMTELVKRYSNGPPKGGSAFVACCCNTAQNTQYCEFIYKICFVTKDT